MRVLFVERCLSDAPDYQVYDQIVRVGKRVDCHSLAVQDRRARMLKGSDVTSVRYRTFPKMERARGLLFVRAAMKAFDEKLAEGGWDILHAHFAYPDGLAVRAIGARHGIPYVVSCLGSDLLVYPHRNRYLREAVRKVVSGAVAVIGVSEHLCGMAAEFGADRERCFHIPDGIRDDVFCSNSEDERAFDTVLFAGAFLPVKNVIRMVEAFSLVRRARQDAVFMFAGEGPLRGKMEDEIERRGMSESCTFLGQLSPEQLAGRMRQANVLCLPSVSEGWGNVIAEAMACGTPVVGANVGGIPEQIVSDEYGYLCDPHSPEDIAEKLIAALGKKWDAVRIAEKGGEYTREAMADRVVDVYRTVLEGH